MSECERKGCRRFIGSGLARPLLRCRWGASVAAPLLLLAVSSFAKGESRAGGPIHVGPSVQVSKDLLSDPHGEIEIGANPQDGGELAACSMLFANNSPSSEVVTYVSFDGGRSWKLSLRTKGQDDNESWDPDCHYGPGHVLYSLSEGTGPDYPESYDRIDRSRDGGKTWEGFARAIHAERSFIVVNDKPGPQSGWVYLYGMGEDEHGIRVGYSTDGGKTFSTQLVPMEEGTYDVNIGPGALLSDGSLVFAMPTLKQSPKESQQGFRVRLPAQIKLVRVKFQRPNWPLEVETSEIAPWFADFEPNGSYYTTLAVDQGHGPFRDRIYAVWEDSSSGRSQVRLSFSKDLGKTWSHPRFINDDVAKQIGDTLHGPDDIHGVVAVNPQGVVGVMWLDRREFPDDLGWTMRFRASLDGGETFLPSVKASNADYDPGRGGRVYLFGSGGSLHVESTNNLAIPWFVFHGGHTMGLAADAQGGFHPLWIANPTDIPQVWTTDLRVDGEVLENGSRELATLQDASKLVRLEFVNRYYDLKSHTLNFDLRLENASKQAIHGPVKVRVLGVGSYVGAVTIPDGADERPAEGTVWDFSSLIADRTFPPRYVTKPIHVRMMVRGINPFTQIGQFTYFLTSLATLDTKVLVGSVDTSQ